MGTAVLSKVCNRTTCHGLPDWYNSVSAGGRTVWSVVLLGALAAITFYSYQMVVGYLRHDTATRISEVRLNAMPFPNVTLCYSGPFNGTHVRGTVHLPPARPLPPGHDETSVRAAFARYLLALAYRTPAVDNDTAEYLEETYQYNFNSTVNSAASDVRAFLNEAAYECERTLTYCAFTLREFPCCDVVTLVWSDYGVCYHMRLTNRDETDQGQAKQFGAGSALGFMLAVTAPMDDDAATGEAGLRVHLTAQLEPNDRGSVLLPVDQHGLVRLNPAMRVTDPSLGACMPDPHHTYSAGLCRHQCLYNASLGACGCVPVGYGADAPSTLVCSPSRMMHCVMPLMQKASPSSDQDQLLRCYEDRCREPCAAWDYAPSVSYTGVGPSSEPDTMRTFVTIYFGEMQYLQIVQQPLTTLEEFVCNLGGMWGLWTGVSAVAFLQCIYIALCGHNEPH